MSPLALTSLESGSLESESSESESPDQVSPGSRGSAPMSMDNSVPMSLDDSESESPDQVSPASKGSAPMSLDDSGSLPVHVAPANPGPSKNAVRSSKRYYPVDDIIADFQDADGTIFVKLRWTGYTAQHDSWEPFSNCSDLLKNYYQSREGTSFYMDSD